MAINAKEIVTPSVMMELKDSIDTAREDTTPHAAVADDEIMVIGDANKIKKQTHDYTVVVVWPRDVAEKHGVKKEDIVKENATHVAFEMEFKDVTIQPINRFKITSALVDILPFFLNPKNDGSVEDRSQKEISQLCVEMSEEILDSLYLFVGSVLDVKKDVYKYFDYASVFELANKFILDFPDVLNEGDF